MVGVENLEVSDRESVQPHSFVGTQTPDALNVVELSVMGRLQVVQDRACGDGRQRRVVEPKPLQRARGELAGNLVGGVGFSEHPVVEFGARNVVPKQGPHVPFALSVDEPLFGFKAPKDAVDPPCVSFSGLELSRAEVEQGQSHGFGRPVNGGHEVVGFAFEHVVVHHQARGDQFGDPAFDKALGLFGVFELVAHGHLQARLDEFGQIRVQTVVREPGQLHLGGAAVSALGEHNVQHLGRGHGVRPKRFVKVPDPEEQHGVRMLDLDPVVLLHQRGFLASHVVRFEGCSPRGGPRK